MDLNPDMVAGDSTVTHAHQNGSPGHVQVVTIHPNSDDTYEDEETKKRRELLSRRPSYRKILNDISSDPNNADSPGGVDTSESNESLNADNSPLRTHSLIHQTQATPSLQTVTVLPHQTIQLAGHGDVSGLQTLTMTNANAPSQTGATIVQYAQSADGQFFIPVAGSGVQAYQISTPTSLPQGVVMTTGGSLGSPQPIGEEQSRKRELRLMKNREAARECRRKKKDYVKCLENRVAVLENQNKQLIDELKSLKELYCQKEAAAVAMADGVTILQTTLQ